LIWGPGSVGGIAIAYRLAVRGSNPDCERVFATVQKCPEDHSSSCTVGTGYFPGVSCCRVVTLTPNPLLVQRYKM
jgi:hypothetical protein